jgi:immunoglobulin-binding protein 1
MESKSLAQAYHEADEALERATTINPNTHNKTFTDNLAHGIAAANHALHLVQHARLFSKNENLDDIHTNDIKYLTLTHIVAELHLKTADRHKRLPALRAALRSHRAFLETLEQLGALEGETRAGWEAARPDAPRADPAATRELKIARHKASKAATERLKYLRSKLALASKLEEEGLDADELEREQVLLLLTASASTAIDSIRASSQELEMLEEMEKLRAPDGSLPRAPREPANDASERFQTLTIGPGGVVTSSPGGLAQQQRQPGRNPAQHRLSYETAMRQLHTGEIPGLYTRSVEEGLRQEEAERAMAEAQRVSESSARADAKRREKEEKDSDGDDDDEMRRLRAKDDWKDNHTRGAGNRKNIS